MLPAFISPSRLIKLGRSVQAVAAFVVVVALAGPAWADVIQDASLPGNLVENPTFDNAPNLASPGSKAIKHAVGWELPLTSGSTALTGWRVSGDGVVLGQVETGTKHLVLFAGRGSLVQTISTVAGQSYTLGFNWLSNLDAPAVKTLVVRVGSVTHSYSLTNKEQDETLPFKADSKETLIEFKSDTRSSHGPELVAARVETTSGDDAFLNDIGKRYAVAVQSYGSPHYFADYAPNFTYQGADGKSRSLDDYKSTVSEQQNPPGANGMSRDVQIQRMELDHGDIHVHLWQRLTYSATEEGRRHVYQIYRTRDDVWTKTNDTWMLSSSSDQGTRTIRDGKEL